MYKIKKIVLSFQGSRRKNISALAPFQIGGHGRFSKVDTPY